MCWFSSGLSCTVLRFALTLVLPLICRILSFFFLCIYFFYIYMLQCDCCTLNPAFMTLSPLKLQDSQFCSDCEIGIGVLQEQLEKTNTEVRCTAACKSSYRVLYITAGNERDGWRRVWGGMEGDNMNQTWSKGRVMPAGCGVVPSSWWGSGHLPFKSQFCHFSLLLLIPTVFTLILKVSVHNITETITNIKNRNVGKCPLQKWDPVYAISSYHLLIFFFNSKFRMSLMFFGFFSPLSLNIISSIFLRYCC